MAEFNQSGKIPKFPVILILVILAGVILWWQGNIKQNESPNQEADLVAEDVLFGESKVDSVIAEQVVYYNDTTGYLARPDGEGPFPALVLIHEWWGLNENIKDLANDFAQQGYVALAVDLYDGESAETADGAGALAGVVRENTTEAFANLTSAVQYLGAQLYVDSKRLASVGWCFGGQWAYTMAKNDLGVQASVMYYGQFSLDDDLSMMRADILGHFGEEDRSIAIDDVREFEVKLKAQGGDHAVFIYPNAGHAFANKDNREAYREDAARLAWERTLQFLDRELSIRTKDVN